MGDKCRPTHFQKKNPTGTNFLEHEWRISCHQRGQTDRRTGGNQLIYPQTSFAGGIINVMYIQSRH